MQGGMEHGVFLFGGVEMDDAGAGPPAPTDRRYTQKQMWHAATLRMLDMGVKAEEVGFDTFWLTEHHFQYEGYEVIPNGVLFGAVLAERTSRIKIGAMFHIVPQWHPLRFAEDFATMHNLSGGRGVLGVGRGTVPSEAQTARHRGRLLRQPRQGRGRPDQPGDDGRGDGRHPLRAGERVVQLPRQALRLPAPRDPRPRRPGRAADARAAAAVPVRDLAGDHLARRRSSTCPRKGFGGVFWLLHHEFVTQRWERFAEIYEKHHGTALAPGEKRQLVLNIRVEDTHEQAWERARPGHDEFWKFLGPYGWSKGYMGADGKPAPPGLIPTLEESVEQKVWIIGSPEEVAEGIAELPRRAVDEPPDRVPALPRRHYDRGRGADGPVHGGGRPAALISACRSSR